MPSTPRRVFTILQQIVCVCSLQPLLIKSYRFSRWKSISPISRGHQFPKTKGIPTIRSMVSTCISTVYAKLQDILRHVFYARQKVHYHNRSTAWFVLIRTKIIIFSRLKSIPRDSYKSWTYDMGPAIRLDFSSLFWTSCHEVGRPDIQHRKTKRILNAMSVSKTWFWITMFYTISPADPAQRMGYLFILPL